MQLLETLSLEPGTDVRLFLSFSCSSFLFSQLVNTFSSRITWLRGKSGAAAREFRGPTTAIEAFHHRAAPVMLLRRAPPAPAMALQPISLLSLVLAWGCVAASSPWHTAVAPPQDLQITDPGLLGSLDIEWKPPPNMQTSNECTVKYKCEYRNTGDREWKVIFTRKLKLRVGFDLSRTAEVKVQTLLKGWCTNDVELQSEWVYATFRVPLQGKLESKVQNFHCIYHDWEYLKCTWQPGLLAPRGVNYALYYWYEGLEHAVQCDDYIQDHGINMGCMLQNLSQAEYRDLSICVNGSVAATSLRPLYATLRLHNLAKPSPPQQLVVSMSAAEELRVAWSPPGGQTPPQCLEYEVQLAEEQGEAKAAWASVSTQVETSFAISRANQSRVSCVRVRGRTNNFCADEGFWSEWTQECFSVSRKEVKQLFILIPVILGLSSSLLIFTLIGQCKKRSPAGKPLHTLVGC